MSANPVIQTFELSKLYHHPFFKWMVSAYALDSLTFQVEPGTVHGLLGPNGSGKSTTIKLVLGLIFPTDGHASIFGKRPDDISVKSRLGFLPEETYLYRFLDAEETLDFYGRLFSLSSRERKHRIDALLDLTGLRAERHRPLAEYSKGMLRRIGIAQSLINDPELVIFDEPTTGLDPIGTRDIKDLILELKSKGKTVLLSSHLLADVEDVCDNVSILYGGVLQADGPMTTLLQQNNLTQITAEMDEATKREVVELIRKRSNNQSEIKVSPPKIRLENLFMQIVESAHSENMATSGVGTSSGRLDFLSQTAEPGILDKLQQESPTASAMMNKSQPVAAEAMPSSASLDALVADEDEEDDSDWDEDEEDSSLVEPIKPNTSLLDKLTQENDV